jgi:hypothetical protein
MSGGLFTASFRRNAQVHRLVLDTQLASQWLDAAEYRSAFCVGVFSTAAGWTIEALLPSGAVAVVGNYDSGNLFDPTMPRFVTINAMCGLPIRFKADQPQPSSELWVVFKS